MTPPPEPDRLARRAEERRRRRAAVARRRRYALIALAGAAAVAGTVVGAGADPDDDGDSPVTTAGGPACPGKIATSARRLVGQMLIVRMEGAATPGLLQAARRGEIGGVILFPPPEVDERVLGREIDALREAAEAGGAPAPLVMIDQEGGEVKRLPDAPPDRDPGELAAAGAAVAFEEGVATGRALAELGIDVDLAPVFDLGPSESFIASRSFGADPAEVSEHALAFADGLRSAGVAATAKHFPGLGLAEVNSDAAPSVVAASRAQLAPGLEPFAAAIARPLELVMVANATYAAYDAARPASQSRKVIDGLLRGELGYDGVVITDDLGAGALAQAGLDEAEAARGAAIAGADLVLLALTEGDDARTSLLQALRVGELDRSALLVSCARVSALRAGLGLSG